MCLSYYRYFIWRITEFLNILSPRVRSKRYRWAMPPPLEFKMTHMEAPRWKGHRKLESMGCIFSLIPTTWTMQIINTKPQSLDRAIYVPVSRAVQKYWHMAALYSFFKIDLLWASLEKTIVMYHIVNSNVFYILFATNKCISACVFSRIKRTGFVVVLTSKSEF